MLSAWRLWVMRAIENLELFDLHGLRIERRGGGVRVTPTRCPQNTTACVSSSNSTECHTSWPSRKCPDPALRAAAVNARRKDTREHDDAERR